MAHMNGAAVTTADSEEEDESTEPYEFGSAGWDDHDYHEWMMECRNDD